MTTTSEQRDVSLDVARSLTLLYIVAVIHGMFYLRPQDQFLASWLLFEMPVIFIISGMAQASSGAIHKRGAQAYIDYLRSRCTRILAPYLVYATIACLAYIMVTRQGDTASALLDWWNPATRGKSHALSKYWAVHLWFVPIMIIITALCPMLARVRPPRAVPFWLLCAALTGTMWALNKVHAPDLVQRILFYGFWCWAGIHMKGGSIAIAKRDAILMITGGTLLLTSAAILSGTKSLDMQTNKFPPNHLFSAFNCIWMGILIPLASAAKKHDNAIKWMARSAILQPFMAYGYSIYLWQGASFGIAIGMSSMLGYGGWATWLIAIIGAMAFGRLFAWAESLQFAIRR